MDKIKESKKRFGDFQRFFDEVEKLCTEDEKSEIFRNNELLGVFLGIKPASEASWFQHDSKGLTKLLPDYIGFNSDSWSWLIFNKESLKELINKHSKYFSKDLQRIEDNNYWRNFFENDSDLDIRRGLIHGFPYDTVCNFEKSTQLFRIIFENRENKALDTHQLSMINLLQIGNHEAIFSAYEFEFIQIFNSLGFQITSEEYSILKSRSAGYLNCIGDFVWVGNCSKADIQYSKGILSFLEDLGVNDFLENKMI